ncbi:MAG: hypothetical protein JSS81_18480 [Acidobacteria bacterium]|nr:hypothetical protein [Acidobacteriota bacterium]
MKIINPRTIVTLLFMLLFATAAARAQTPRLEGQWEMYNDTNVKFDKLAKIAQSGNNLSINNGYGANSTGVLNGNTLTTSDGLTGTVSPDGTRITWSIGYTWVKQGVKTAPAGLDLNGNWAMYEGDGKKYEKNAVITQSGASVTLDNGYGSRTTINLNGYSLAATEWGLTGKISDDSGRIDWSNGFYWIKNLFGNRTEVGTLEQKEQQRKEATPSDNRTLTLRNGGAINVTVNLYKAGRPKYDNTPVKSIKWVDGGTSPSVDFGIDLKPGDALEAEITMKVMNGLSTRDITIYRAAIPAGAGNLCFEVGGTVYKPSAGPCAGTKAVELDYVTLRNEAGFMAKMSLDYTAQTGAATTAPKTISTDDTILGFERKIYLPYDARAGQMTLKVSQPGTVTADLLSTKLQTSAKFSACFKVWGDAVIPKISACSTDGAARTIKFWNNSGGNASMEVVYDGSRKTVTNYLNVTQTETLEIPPSKVPVRVNFVIDRGTNPPGFTVPADFTGELCFKVEGLKDAATSATCDDVVGEAFGDTRRIRFQNEAGFDAQLIVSYFTDEVINGNTVAMPKLISTGFINGLGGKYRFVAIPKKTSVGMPVMVSIQGSTTVKNNVWSTTLPADFTDNPQPCFKVWGTLFDPQGGKCKE